VDETTVAIDAHLAIPSEELSWQFSRATGPGGQNVNKTATRVELIYDVGGSPSLSDTQRERIRARLPHLIDQTGMLHIVSQATASQWQNRRDALAKFRALLGYALQPQHPRLPTRTPPSERLRRREGKRRQGQKKQRRRPPSHEEW
jgi:ribosome-associated protein